MADIDSILHGIFARLDTVERDNATLKVENHALRAKVAALAGRTTVATVPAPAVGAMEQMSRRWVLRRGMQLTAASVAAGALLRHTTPEAAAGHTAAVVDANWVLAHYVRAERDSGETSISGTATHETQPAISGNNFLFGPGVKGHSRGNGVQGSSFGADASGVYGFSEAGTFGVAGDTTSAATTDIALARAGVFGRNNGTGAGVLGLSVNRDGDGVYGAGKVGVHGTSANGSGLLGEGGTGYGGVFKGAKAQVRLTPTGRAGRPTTGYHQIGELYLDKVGALFICTTTGTPGTWRKVSTVLA